MPPAWKYRNTNYNKIYNRKDQGVLPHRLAAAARATSARRSGVMAAARAAPPLRPMLTAAASLPLSGSGASFSSPVAIRMTFTAAPITSAGRCSPLGPLGITLHLLNVNLVGAVAVLVAPYRIQKVMVCCFVEARVFRP